MDRLEVGAVNLAPWAYRNVRSDRGGPIEDIVYQPIRLLSGESAFEASARLSSTLQLIDSRPLSGDSQVYGRFDGTGTALYTNAACYKAISEALEKWALLALRDTDRRKLYGFDVDPYTNGMAAFPGLTAKSARAAAFREAVERWSLVGWWSGHIAIEEIRGPFPGIQVFQLQSVLPRVETVILFGKSRIKDAACFAFASSISLEKAILHASVELERNQRAIDRFYEERGLTPDDAPKAIPELRSVLEKRLIYFSSKRGMEHFLDRLHSREVAQWRGTPELMVDSEINGPWTVYATVWRCMFRNLSTDHLSDRYDFFLF